MYALESSNEVTMAYCAPNWEGWASITAQELLSISSRAFLASPDESFEVDSDSRVRPGPASPWTCESQLTALVC